MLNRPTYVFRPTPGNNLTQVLGKGSWLRYGGGLWVEDDGEFDLAFVSMQTPVALGVKIPYRDNLEWEWMDMDVAVAATGVENAEKSLIRPWHIQIHDPTKGWGEHHGIGSERDSHPNEIAHRSAMDKCCQLHGCANGRGPHFVLPDAWVEAGLLRITRYLLPILAPANPVCYLCLNDGFGHKLLYLRELRRKLDGALEHSKERHDRLEVNCIDEARNILTLESRLRNLDSLPLDVRAIADMEGRQ